MRASALRLNSSGRPQKETLTIYPEDMSTIASPTSPSSQLTSDQLTVLAASFSSVFFVVVVVLMSIIYRKDSQCFTLLCASQGQKLKPSSSPGILVSRAKGFKLKRHQPSEDNTVEKRREITIRCLIVYIGEKEEDLFKQYSDVEELNADLAMQVMKIAIIGDGPETIIVEESKILEGIDAARSCVLLMGVIYTLNLTYPKQLKFTFEVFQKLCLELDGQKASSKVTNLKLGIF
uniref:Uncharacterized protein n=1 Tax=Nothobranchius furzeri TaxID=105023 RepID=A0A1A8AEG8_NOTFU